MEEKASRTNSWFWEWILNNKIVSILLICLLVVVNLFLFTKILPFLKPVREFISIIGSPMISAGILYYLVKPLHDFLLKRGIPKIVSIIGIFTLLIILLLAAIFSFIPFVEKQLSELLNQMPYYYRVISTQVDKVIQSGAFSSIQEQLNTINMDFIQSLTTRLNSVLNVTVSGIGSVVGVVGEFVIALVTMPIFLFYLLQDGERILPAVLKIFPTHSRNRIGSILVEMNQQISYYIRGQLTVAIAVAIMFMIGYAIIGLPYGLTIAILAGALNVIPFVGSFLGMIPALVVGIVVSPLMFVQVCIVFIVEQTLEGQIISPLILGNSLKIHPVTILVVLLTTGKIFGVIGLLLGVPIYAILKVLFIHLFDWYKEHSGLHPDEISQVKQSVAEE